jgi:hypothetical protein
MSTCPHFLTTVLYILGLSASIKKQIKSSQNYEYMTGPEFTDRYFSEPPAAGVAKQLMQHEWNSILKSNT